MPRRNLGTLDRDIRLIMAVLFGLTALFAPFGGPWQIIPLVLSGVLLVTSAMAFCPLYGIFGFSTYRPKAKEPAAK